MKPTKSYSPGFFAKLFGSDKWKVSFHPDNKIKFDGSNACFIEAKEILSIRIEEGVVWDSLSIELNKRPDIPLTGLKAKAAQALKDNLKKEVQDQLEKLILANKEGLNRINVILAPLLNSYSSYLSNYDAASAMSIMESAGGNLLSDALSHPLFNSNNDSIADLLPPTVHILLNDGIRKRYNSNFVKKSLENDKAFFDDFGGMSLSAEQRESCVRLEDSNLLVACAGSGKTATIVAKVAYVVKKGFYKPEEILVLAFNKDAAQELRDRVAKQIGDQFDTLPEIATFHAFGKKVIADVQGKVPKLANWVENEKTLSKAIDKIIDDLIENDDQFYQDWKKLLTVYPESEKEYKNLSEEEQIQEYKSLKKTLSSLSGINVRSIQELQIANWLFINKVPFEYEKPVELVQYEKGPDGQPVQKKVTVHADFYYPSINRYHEHFAIDKSGKSPFKGYVNISKKKKEGYKNAGIDLIETSSGDAQNGQMLHSLKDQLEKHGMVFGSISLKEVTKLLDPLILNRYQSLVLTCLKHIQSNRLELDNLLLKARKFEYSERAVLFSKVIMKIADRYEQCLRASGCIDFEDMIAMATQMIEQKQYESPFRFILADEFQDISQSRAGVIHSLRKQVKGSKFFAVGDDWQSIYRFSGSDLALFTHFEKHFGSSWIGKLQTTFRCNQLIAETAADFVQKNPEQLKKGVTSVKEAIPKSIRTELVEERVQSDAWGPYVFRMLDRINNTARNKKAEWMTEDKPQLKVLVLFRYNNVNPFKWKAPQFSHIRVETYSFHRSKGLEADYSILVNVSDENYGVPSKIEDDELLHLVIPEPESYDFAEERRLFYVALTRASRACFILAPKSNPSRYLYELKQIAGEGFVFSDPKGSSLAMCPSCKKGFLVEKTSKYGNFLSCNRFPKCKYKENY